MFGTPWVCGIHNEIKSAISIKKCSRVLAVSQYLKDSLIRKTGLKENQVTVLNVAVDTKMCKRKKNKIEAKGKIGIIKI